MSGVRSVAVTLVVLSACGGEPSEGNTTTGEPSGTVTTDASAGPGTSGAETATSGDPGSSGSGSDTDSGGPLFDIGGGTGGMGECHDVLDLVFVLDTSSSMSFILNDLQAEIGAVVTASADLGPDADPHFGFIGFQDNHAMALGGPLENGSVHTEAATLQAAFAYFRQTYTNFDRNPGDGPDGLDTQNPLCEENSLDALYAAALTYPWRDQATRVVILVTDDTFLEDPDNYGDGNGNGIIDPEGPLPWPLGPPREGDYPALRTLAETVDALTQRQIRVFSFSRQSGVASDCGTGRRLDDSQGAAGWSIPYMGATPIPVVTDGQDFDVHQVEDGSLSLTATINEVVLESYCVPPQG